MRVAGRHATLMTLEFVVITSVFSVVVDWELTCASRILPPHGSFCGFLLSFVPKTLNYKRGTMNNHFCRNYSSAISFGSWFGIHEKIAKVHGWRLILPANFFFWKQISSFRFKFQGFVASVCATLLEWPKESKKSMTIAAKWHDTAICLIDSSWSEILKPAGIFSFGFIPVTFPPPPDLMLHWCF